jgi:hypothetical protein
MSPVPDDAAANDADANASAKPPVVLALPPIALSELKQPTKAYLLARAGTGRAPLETVKELLDRGARRVGCGAAGAAMPEGGQTRR